MFLIICVNPFLTEQMSVSARISPKCVKHIPQTINAITRNLFCCCHNALTKMREGSCEGEKKQSKSSTTNMPLSLLMVSTSPYSGSLQLAIKVLTVVDSWCSRLSAGQVVQSCIQTHTICYFRWCLAQTEGIMMLYFSLSPVFSFTFMATWSTIFSQKIVWKTSFSYFWCAFKFITSSWLK